MKFSRSDDRSMLKLQMIQGGAQSEPVTSSFTSDPELDRELRLAEQIVADIGVDYDEARRLAAEAMDERRLRAV